LESQTKTVVQSVFVALVGSVHALKGDNVHQLFARNVTAHSIIIMMMLI
jgi:hypothetical protein